jgi:hypothetical protein
VWQALERVLEQGLQKLHGQRMLRKVEGFAE